MINQLMEVKPKAPIIAGQAVQGQPVYAKDALATQREDNALAAAVERALEKAAVLNSRHFNDFTLAVHDGIVLLRGHVLRANSRKQIEQVAAQIPGVAGVENQLVADSDLENEVAHALIAVTTESQDRLFVNVHQGIIDLSGKASSAAVRDAAEQCAANVPHVRAVVNSIEAPNVVPEAGGTRVVQPPIGQRVLGQDMSLGHIETVIINPRNRRVSAIVVYGKFPAAAQSTRHLFPGDMPRQERRVVIPLSALQHVGPSQVLLGISGVQAAQYAEFNPASFARAEPNWLPPYPYNAADVMLELPVPVAA